jgi:intein-encoded DNA endonuclease-like protein
MIQRLMNGYGLQRRTRSEARKWAIRRGKFKGLEYSEMDEKFFTKWSPEMAWILGLIFTDGNLTNSGVVTLTSIDLEMLEKVKSLLDSTIHIRKQTQGYDKSKYIYILRFGHEKMTQNLKKLGLTTQKSLTMTFPDIPEEYVRHFIRGCWDGDGSVYFEKRRPGEIKASYTSGSKQFIKRIVLELYKVGIGKYGLSDQFYKNHPFQEKLTIYRHPYKQARYIRISGKKNCQRLFHYFYDNVDESLYLKRKYEVFKKVLDS